MNRILINATKIKCELCITNFYMVHVYRLMLYSMNFIYVVLSAILVKKCYDKHKWRANLIFYIIKRQLNMSKYMFE